MSVGWLIFTMEARMKSVPAIFVPRYFGGRRPDLLKFDSSIVDEQVRKHR